jgi:DNA-binding transcriptional LysR family regulator
MSDWNDLKYFLAVARHGSTLAAAKALRVSQSTVHRRLDILEKSIGRRLVKRLATGYRLTELGEEMRAYAESVEDAVAAFTRRVHATETELIGTIRITCPEAVGYRLMRSPLPEKFGAAFPHLRLEFVMTDRVVDLAKGQADVAIRAVTPVERDLVGRKIADCPWAIFASRAYRDKYGALERREELNGHAIVGFDGVLQEHSAGRWLRAVAPQARVAARATSIPAVVLAVKSGAGLAPLPVIVGDQDSDLVEVLSPLPDLSTPFHLVIHEDMRQTPRVRSFFDFVVREIALVRSVLEGCALDRHKGSMSASDH